MVSKEISIWRSRLTVWIGYLDFWFVDMRWKHRGFGASISTVAQLSLSLSLSLYIYIYIYTYIYRDRIKYFIKHESVYTLGSLFEIRNANDRSEPLEIFFMSKSIWRPNFTFFRIFLIFYLMIWKRVILDTYMSSDCCTFQS